MYFAILDGPVVGIFEIGVDAVGWHVPDNEIADRDIVNVQTHRPERRFIQVAGRPTGSIDNGAELADKRVAGLGEVAAGGGVHARGEAERRAVRIRIDE